MRRNALLVLGTGVAAALFFGAQPARAGYDCSPGFAASYGRCIATASTDEVDLYLNEPGYAEAPRVVRHRHRRHELHDRY